MRKQLSKSDIKQFLDEHSFASGLMSKKSAVVLDDDQLFVDGQLCFLRFTNQWIPSLRLLMKDVSLLPRVVVDKGAIKFVVNGADIMRPGITSVDDFSSQAIVVVVDEGFNKPLAVGKALYSSSELLLLSSGKVVSLLHHVGDAYWENS